MAEGTVSKEKAGVERKTFERVMQNLILQGELDNAEKIAKILGDKKALVDIWFREGSTEAAAHLALKIGDRDGLDKILSWWSERGWWTDAIRYAMKAEEKEKAQEYAKTGLDFHFQKLKTDPYDRLALKEVAEIYRALSEHDKAIEYYTKAGRLDEAGQTAEEAGWSEEAYRLYMEDRDYDEAMRVLVEGSSQNPPLMLIAGYLDAAKELADEEIYPQYEEEGRFEEAAKLAKKLGDGEGRATYEKLGKLLRTSS